MPTNRLLSVAAAVVLVLALVASTEVVALACAAFLAAIAALSARREPARVTVPARVRRGRRRA